MNSRIIILGGLAIAFFACTGPGRQPAEVAQETVQEVQKSEAELLIDYLSLAGDYVNSRNFPSMIKAATAYEGLGGNNLFIDLRKPEHFRKGHIRGAVNVSFAGIPDFFETKIVPFQYDKIILVCYGGQISGYATCLLRLMGYGNVYSLRWGMSAWNRVFAEEAWLRAVSDKYEDRLETDIRPEAAPGDLPEIRTGKKTGEEILAERYRQLFREEVKGFQVSADEVFADPGRYYIVNFDRKDKYEAGHIPGAIRYKPNATLGIIPVMKTIPAGKDVVIYCGTGQNSSFATAYLRLIGYNAFTLEYGNNAFMHSRMVRDKVALSWIPFTEEDIEDLPYVKE